MMKDKAYLLVGSYYRGEDERSRRYYRMYLGSIGDSRVYASSTLVEVERYKPAIEVEWRELRRGEYHLYEIDRNAIKATGVIEI